MKRDSVVLVFAFALLSSMSIQAQQPALQVITVNTSDAAGYVEWSKTALPVIADNFEGVLLMGTCIPTQGAQMEGDIYSFGFASSHDALLAVDLNSPAVASEISRVASMRRVRARDVWSVLRNTGRAIPVGGMFALYNLFVNTNSSNDYVSALSRIEAALHENGFDDVAVAAYYVNTGEYAGQVVASFYANSTQRLGALLDAMNGASFAEVFASIEATREVVRGEILNCQAHAVGQ